jgi:uncharacterized membrane protein YeaQ/YmgE (transglycosylase-associated protein family)
VGPVGVVGVDVGPVAVEPAGGVAGVVPEGVEPVAVPVGAVGVGVVPVVVEPAAVPVVAEVEPAGDVAGVVPGSVFVPVGGVAVAGWPVAVDGVPGAVAEGDSVVPGAEVGLVGPEVCGGAGVDGFVTEPVAGVVGATVTGGIGARAGTQSTRREPVSFRPTSVPVPVVTRYRYQIGAPAATGGRNDVRATVTDPALVVSTSVPVVTPSAMLPGVCRSPATATGPPRAVMLAVPWNLNSAPVSGLA